MEKADQCPAAQAFFRMETETATPEAREAQWNEGFLAAIRTAFKKSSPFNRLLTKSGLTRGDLNSRQALARVQIVRPAADPKLTASLEAISAQAETTGINWQQALFAAGLRPGHGVHITVDRKQTGLARALDQAALGLGCTSLYTGAAGLDFQINQIKMLTPTAVLTTPDWLIYLDRHAGRIRMDIKRDLKVAVWLTAGDIMASQTRERLEQRLGCQIWQTYFVSGIGCLGYECAARAGLHVPDGILPEILDNKTQASLEPGRFGEFTATLLDPRHPIFRLATGDSGSIDDQPCTCGRTSPRFLIPTQRQLLFS